MLSGKRGRASVSHNREVLRLIVQAINSADIDESNAAGGATQNRIRKSAEDSERLAATILRNIEEAGFVVVPEEDIHA
jgi:hypothetical protein